MHVQIYSYVCTTLAIKLLKSLWWYTEVNERTSSTTSTLPSSHSYPHRVHSILQSWHNVWRVTCSNSIIAWNSECLYNNRYIWMSVAWTMHVQLYIYIYEKDYVYARVYSDFINIFMRACIHISGRPESTKQNVLPSFPGPVHTHWNVVSPVARL